MRVREYLRQQTPQFARVTRKSPVNTLCSFLRFAFGAGYLEPDVASAIEQWLHRIHCLTIGHVFVSEAEVRCDVYAIT
jgi:hypothetical protein